MTRKVSLMEKSLQVLLASFLLSSALAPLRVEGAKVEVSTPRPARFAGSFYPADPSELRGMIQQFLGNAPKRSLDGNLQAIIVPHAGYKYSGQVAAHAYKQLVGKSFDTVILMGRSHNQGYPGASIWPEGSWQTPFGEVPVDEELARRLKDSHELLRYDSSPHLEEHALEVEIPFLQTILSPGFKIVPILLGDFSLESSQVLAKSVVEKTVGQKVLIVVSTDMSHYHSSSEAEEMDAETLKLFEKEDSRELFSALSSGTRELCGGSAVLTLFQIADLLHWESDILTYAHSGNAGGDPGRVVGYSAVAFYEPAISSNEEILLNQEQEKRLMTLARRSLEDYLQKGKLREAFIEDPVLMQSRGVFVTLEKAGELRGCIGNISGTGPLYRSVQDNAIAAATRDPRFPPVKPEELEPLRIKISVLSPLQPIQSADEIILGRHGVVVEKGGKSGVFLPEVARDTGWDKGTFLAELCRQKAGLGKHCWQEKGAKLYVFTAQEFGEI